MSDPEVQKQPLTRERLLSIVEYKLWEIEEMGKKTGKIIPGELERFRKIKQVFEQCVADVEQSVSAQLFTSLARLKLSLADPNFSGDKAAAQRLLDEIGITFGFVRAEMALPTDREPRYQEWRVQKST